MSTSSKTEIKFKNKKIIIYGVLHDTANMQYVNEIGKMFSNNDVSLFIEIDENLRSSVIFDLLKDPLDRNFFSYFPLSEEKTTFALLQQKKPKLSREQILSDVHGFDTRYQLLRDIKNNNWQMALYGDYSKFTLNDVVKYIISPLLPFLTNKTKNDIDKLYLGIVTNYKTDDIIKNYINNCFPIVELMYLLREIYSSYANYGIYKNISNKIKKLKSNIIIICGVSHVSQLSSFFSDSKFQPPTDKFLFKKKSKKKSTKKSKKTKSRNI